MANTTQPLVKFVMLLCENPDVIELGLQIQVPQVVTAFLNKNGNLVNKQITQSTMVPLLNTIAGLVGDSSDTDKLEHVFNIVTVTYEAICKDSKGGTVENIDTETGTTYYNTNDCIVSSSCDTLKLSFILYLPNLLLNTRDTEQNVPTTNISVETFMAKFIEQCDNFVGKFDDYEQIDDGRSYDHLIPPSLVKTKNGFITVAFMERMLELVMRRSELEGCGKGCTCFTVDAFIKLFLV